MIAARFARFALGLNGLIIPIGFALIEGRAINLILPRKETLVARWRTHHNRKRSAEQRPKWAAGGLISSALISSAIKSGTPVIMGWDLGRDTSHLAKAFAQVGLRGSDAIKALDDAKGKLSISIEMPDSSRINDRPGSITAAADAYRNPLYDELRRQAIEARPITRTLPPRPLDQ